LPFYARSCSGKKLLKTIATRCAIFSLKFTKTIWRPGFAWTRWGSLSVSPDPLAAIWSLLLRRGREGRGGREGIGKGMGKGRGKVGERGGGRRGEG